MVKGIYFIGVFPLFFVFFCSGEKQKSTDWSIYHFNFWKQDKVWFIKVFEQRMRINSVSSQSQVLRNRKVTLPSYILKSTIFRVVRRCRIRLRTNFIWFQGRRYKEHLTGARHIFIMFDNALSLFVYIDGMVLQRNDTATIKLFC